MSEPPAWAGLLAVVGCLAALLFFLLFLASLFTGKPEADGSVTVADEAGLLSAECRAALAEIVFPGGTPVVVRTVTSIPRREIGTFATAAMTRDPRWSAKRPRGFLRRVVRQDPSWGPGVFVLVSREPRLLQIRFGRQIRMAAYQEHLAAGDWYRAQQDFEEGDLDRHLVATLEDLAVRMERVVDPPWPLSWARWMSSSVASEVEDFLAPSDGLYSEYVLATYLRIARAFGGTGSARRFLAFNLAFFVAVWLFVKGLLVEGLLAHAGGPGWVRLLASGIANLGLLTILLTGFAALALLSRGRFEDELALEELGIGFLSSHALGSSLFSTSGKLWLAIPGFFVALLVSALESARLSEESHGQTVGCSLGWLCWPCAFYLLPVAIGLPALGMLVWGAGSALVASAAREA